MGSFKIQKFGNSFLTAAQILQSIKGTIKKKKQSKTRRCRKDPFQRSTRTRKASSESRAAAGEKSETLLGTLRRSLRIRDVMIHDQVARIRQKDRHNNDEHDQRHNGQPNHHRPLGPQTHVLEQN